MESLAIYLAPSFLLFLVFGFSFFVFRFLFLPFFFFFFFPHRGLFGSDLLVQRLFVLQRPACTGWYLTGGKRTFGSGPCRNPCLGWNVLIGTVKWLLHTYP